MRERRCNQDYAMIILLVNCKKVTYRVYSFVTISQGYPDILSCDLNKHVSCLSEHVIIESYGIHYNPLVLMKSLDHFDL